jgi:hypothetical protein
VQQRGRVALARNCPTSFSAAIVAGSRFLPRYVHRSADSHLAASMALTSTHVAEYPSRQAGARERGPHVAPIAFGLRHDAHEAGIAAGLAPPRGVAAGDPGRLRGQRRQRGGLVHGYDLWRAGGDCGHCTAMRSAGPRRMGSVFSVRAACSTDPHRHRMAHRQREAGRLIAVVMICALEVHTRAFSDCAINP